MQKVNMRSKKDLDKFLDKKEKKEKKLPKARKQRYNASELECP